MELHAINAREISPDESRIAPAGRRYTLAALLGVFALNFIDLGRAHALQTHEREAPCAPATVSAPGGMR